MILHFSQIFLTELLTFIVLSLHRCRGTMTAVVLSQYALQAPTAIGCRRNRQTLPLTVTNDEAMFKMRTRPAVRRYRRPAVVEHLDVLRAGVDHRFDGQHHARLQLRTAAPGRKIRHLRLG